MLSTAGIRGQSLLLLNTEGMRGQLVLLLSLILMGVAVVAALRLAAKGEIKATLTVVVGVVLVLMIAGMSGVDADKTGGSIVSQIFSW